MPLFMYPLHRHVLQAALAMMEHAKRVLLLLLLPLLLLLLVVAMIVMMPCLSYVRYCINNAQKVSIFFADGLSGWG